MIPVRVIGSNGVALSYTEVARWSGKVATGKALAPALAGKIEAVLIACQGEWRNPPVGEVPLGTELVVWVSWRNESPVNARGRLTMVVTTPGGDSYEVAVKEGQGQVMAPGYAIGVTFYPFQIVTQGDYRAEVILGLEQA